MQLFQNDQPFCPILGIQEADSSELLAHFDGAAVPLGANRLFHILTPRPPSIHFDIRHSIRSTASQKLWPVHIKKTLCFDGRYLSEIFVLSQQDLAARV